MNTIYRLKSDVTNFCSFIQKPPLSYDNIIDRLAMWQDWKPFGENYQPPELELRRNSENGKKNYQFDFSGSLRPFFVISETALEALKDILEPRGQILPVITESRRKKFWGYYPTNPLSGCMDMEKSAYRKFPNGLMVDKPVLIAGNITDEYLFSIEEDTRVFVTEKFRQRVEAAGLVGFDFSTEIPTTDSLKSTVYVRPEQAITRPPEMQNIAIKHDTYDIQFSSFYDDEQQGFLYILQDSLDEGLYYAKKITGTVSELCVQVVM